jgi:hypothetical protein
MKNNSVLKVARTSKRKTACDGVNQKIELQQLIDMKIFAFDKQLEFYKNNDIEIQSIVRRINNQNLFYSDVKKYVLSNYNVMTYPNICEQLYTHRECIHVSRMSVMELLIENLSEKFNMYKMDTFDNI